MCFFFADPEELLQSLLSQTLKAAPFLELSSGQTAHLYQLFVERDESKSLPSVQELFEQSFLKYAREQICDIIADLEAFKGSEFIKPS